MVEALDPTLALSDYYLDHPWCDDGGYLQALVEKCRETVVRLPSYEHVRPLALRAARLAQVLAINHEPDPALRDAELRAWAARHHPASSELAWFEWTGGASAWLTILALVALAADAGLRPVDAQAAYDAYLPWLSLAGTMLDSYADATEDQASGAHSYIAHYGHEGHAAQRLGTILACALQGAAALPNGERHVVLASCMVGMYLSRDSARTPQKRATTMRIAAAAGPLPEALVPVLRAWRLIYGQRADKEDHTAPGATGRRVTIPRRAGLPLSAPAPALVQTFAFWRDPHAYLAWCRDRYGSRFTIRPVGMPPMVFLSKPQDIRAIVRAPANILHPGAGAAVISPLVGEGSFMLAEEETHLRGRRAILPAFQHHRVHDHTEMVNDTVKREIAIWPRDRAIAIHPYLRALTLRIILKTIFGLETAPLRELHTRLLAMLTITGSLALQEPHLRHLQPWRHHWRRFLAERSAVDQIIGDLIAKEAHAPARESGLLGMLLDTASAQGEHADPKQTRDDLMSVILAGHETTASELAWAFQLLAHHQHVTARLAMDLDSGDDAYLKATVHEVLRHRPVFLFTIPRVVRSPIEIDGCTFAPPVHLIGCIHLMHHDPILYEEPGRFRPERFLARDPPADLWMPWGGGRKRCPGHHLALLEMQLVLKAVLSEMQILPVADRIETARWRSVIVTPGRGSRIILRRRSGAKLQQRPPLARPSRAWL